MDIITTILTNWGFWLWVALFSASLLWTLCLSWLVFIRWVDRKFQAWESRQ